MAIVSIGMFLVFGFLMVRHILNRRYFWAVIAGFGFLLGAAGIWVDFQRASDAAANRVVEPA